MTKNSELMTRDESPGERAMMRPAATPQQMMQSMIASGVTAENVAAFTELVKLSEHMEDRTAAREFARAFSDLQQMMPTIQAERAVPDKSGGVRFKYAPTEDIMKQLQPHLTQHGFSISFSQKLGDKSITSLCTVTHIGGHSRTTEFSCRTGAGPYGGTERDADVAGGTVAQREALCDAFNIVRRRDGNAGFLGAPITPDQADELARRVQLTNSNREAFLKFAGASDFNSILSAKYDVLDGFLRKKEGAGK